MRCKTAFPASNILCGACPTVSGQQPSVFKREIIGVCMSNMFSPSGK